MIKMDKDYLMLEEKLYQDFNYEFTCLRHKLGLTQQEMADKSKDEGNETVTNCHQLKLKATDGKMRLTDVVDIEGMFIIILLYYFF